MTTNKVCGKGKCKFTDEFCASGDCPYDTENVANNVAQQNSQDLTKLWKRGKLEFGKEYYVRFEDGEISTARWCYYTNQDRYGFDVDDIVEVLAPVPSYEEYKDLKLHDEKATIKLGEKIIENDKLKSLLKEWIHYYPIVLYEYEDTLKTKDIIELYERTREVLK